MRQISEATKITKVVTKILALLEKEELTYEQVESVLKSTEVSLGIKPPKPELPPFATSDVKLIENMEG